MGYVTRVRELPCSDDANKERPPRMLRTQREREGVWYYPYI